jgi:CxxC motif-containing protein (DUF1111 family)
MRRFFRFIGLCVLGFAVTVVVAQNVPPSALLGGDNTVFDTSGEAFTNPLPLLTASELEQFEEGDELFEEVWRGREGLGPVFNATSCEGCHIEDGRGRPPAFTGETGTGLLIRLALNQQNANGSALPDPIYGGQFQDDSIRRTDAEGTIDLSYQPIVGTYPDGTSYTLYQPTYNLVNLNYGALHSDIAMSPRLAGQMIGLGLLEAIPDQTLMALSDPNDANGDGISGRVNIVWDAVAGASAVGRFGWKANQPNLLQQSAGAFNGDIGITSSIFSDQPCTDFQFECFLNMGNRRNNGRHDNRRENGPPSNGGRNNNNPPPNNRGGNNPPPPPNGGRNNNNPPPNGGGNNNRIEVTDEELELVTFYSSTLAVPAQRNPNDPQVMLGQVLFDSANCSSCHIPTLQTGVHSISALSNQTIHPYTDLLLHDMGAGLADGQLDFQASGSEWRTAPLWGIGLLEEVNGYAFYLHDGRARTLEEAIMWHGGEATASQNAFASMSAENKAALIAFLKSL